MPEAVAKWLEANPQYMDPNDIIARHEIQLATLKTARDGKTWDHPDFIPTLERHLGRGQASNGSGNGHAPVIERPAPPPPPRNVAPPPQRRAYSAPVSAPPTRDAPSMSTGRPASESRIPISADERTVALQCRQPGDSDEMAIRRYAENKRRMLAMKASGDLQG
jgi:hypothetical protein